MQLIKRIDGEFFERFELQSFPFDAQDLTITVSANVANEGPVPVSFVVNGPESACPPQLGVDTVNFAFGDVWDLAPTLLTEVTTLGASSKRRFPAFHLRACVSRKPGFVVLNVQIPTTVIALLAVTTFFVELELTISKLDFSVTILLTAVAFKCVFIHDSPPRTHTHGSRARGVTRAASCAGRKLKHTPHWPWSPHR